MFYLILFIYKATGPSFHPVKVASRVQPTIRVKSYYKIKVKVRDWVKLFNLTIWPVETDLRLNMYFISYEAFTGPIFRVLLEPV